MPRLNAIGDKLMNAYQPRPQGKRQIIGRLLSGIVPGIGEMISGDTERQRQEQGLGSQFGLLSQIIARNRAAQMGGVNMRHVQSQIGEQDALTALHNKQTELAGQPKPTVDEQTWQGYLTATGGDPVKANRMRLQDAQDVKPEKPPQHSNPFEAFAYGDANERKAAQDFIALEGRQKLANRPPSEVEERYRLFQQNPDTYRAMFGDRGGSQDQAQAARMLKYFEARRKEVDGDFTLDDATKQQKLGEIGELEKPYLDAAQPRGTSRAGGNAGGDTGQGAGARPGEVEVISPDGQRGYIPSANLPKALKRGYKQAAAQ